MTNKFLPIILLCVLTLDASGATKKKIVKPIEKPKIVRVERAIAIDSPENTALLQKYVVLPPGFENQPIVVEDSAAYKELLSENKTLQKQHESDIKTYNEFQKKVDVNIQQQAEQIKKDEAKLKKLEAEARKRSWFHWIFGLGTFGLIGGGIALLIFFPALLPLVGTILGRVASGFVAFINFIVNFIAGLFKKN